MCIIKQEVKFTTRSKGPVFNFKNHCFMCGVKVNSEFLADQTKLPVSKSNNVIIVEMARLRETVWKAAENEEMNGHTT